MKITSIKIGNRHRKDLGDLTSLAESIATEGLLQPIGITATGELVFGERRLRACELLGWAEIATRIVNVTSIAAGEYAENEMRKDFTPSERVAIARAVKQEIGERRGNPDLKAIVPNRAQLDGKKSRQIAAERSGFGSATSLGRAEKVVNNGVPELVEAMDKGKVSLAAAERIADLPAEGQREAVVNGNGLQHGSGSYSRKAQFKHPTIKLENAANSLEVVADGLASLDLKRLHDVPRSEFQPLIDRMTKAVSGIKRSLNALGRGNHV